MEITDIITTIERIRQVPGAEIDGETNRKLREAQDILFDYDRMADQVSDLQAHYQTPEPAVLRGREGMRIWQCPACTKMVHIGNDHCNWCGKRLEWGKGRRRKGR